MHSHHFQIIVQEHNTNNICNTTWTLLKQGIFASTLYAKIRFPEVFNVSLAQSAERAILEAEAARSEADAVKEYVERHQGVFASIPVDELE